jgi:hypothetical protein
MFVLNQQFGGCLGHFHSHWQNSPQYPKREFREKSLKQFVDFFIAVRKQSWKETNTMQPVDNQNTNDKRRSPKILKFDL